jgi:GTP-binding protein
MSTEHLRNVAIIAHVDHGKTSLIDILLRQSHSLSVKDEQVSCIMDSNDLERERGITILSKVTGIQYKNHRINIVDTPGHADFGGEVERVLNMVEGVLLIVCAFEGPMPQTRFVLKKALERKLTPIVILNKIDRPGVNIQNTINRVYDLFIDLGDNDAMLDFPILFASARKGYAKKNVEDPDGEDMSVVFDQILETIPPPENKVMFPLQIQLNMISHDPYLGSMAIGKVRQGKIAVNDMITVVRRNGAMEQERVLKLRRYQGVKTEDVNVVSCGDIAMFVGLEDLCVGETITDSVDPCPLPYISVDEPTLTMNFLPNDSPFSGQEGTYVTSRHLRDRLFRELKSNVGLQVLEHETFKETFKVNGRGELHLSILIETMRREGYEFSVSRPQVILKTIVGVLHEPWEILYCEVPNSKTGVVMETVAKRKGQLKNMIATETRSTLEFLIPTRGLIGFRNELMTGTQGEGVAHHLFHDFLPYSGEIRTRSNGSLIAYDTGTSMNYSLWKLEPRGRLFIDAGLPVYEGMIVGEHSRDNDLVVNVTKNKHLTNVRAAGHDEDTKLTPPKKLTLEESIEFIAEDELVEITPKNIRLRKKYLTENERKRKKPKEG